MKGISDGLIRFVSTPRYDLAAGQARDDRRARSRARRRTASKWSVWLLASASAVYGLVSLVPTEQEVLDRLRADITDASRWGAAAAVLAQRNDPLAEAYYAMALLLNPSDSRWRERNPSLRRSIEALKALEVGDDDWVGGILARSADRQRDFAAARALFDYALALDRADGRWKAWSDHEVLADRVVARYGDAEAWGRVADSFMRLGLTGAAAESYALARLIDPDARGWRQRNPDLAQAAAAARRFNTRRPDWLAERARVAEGLGAFEAAARLYETAQGTEPGDQRWLRRATVARLRQRLTARSNDHDTWGDLGDAHAALGQQEETSGAYAVARLLAPANPEWIKKATDLTAAARTLRAANVRDDELIGSLGDSARRLGNVPAARALYDLAASFDSKWRQQRASLESDAPGPPPPDDPTDDPTERTPPVELVVNDRPGTGSAGPASPDQPAPPPPVPQVVQLPPSLPPPVRPALPAIPQPTRLVIQADYEVRVAVPGKAPASAAKHAIDLAPGRYQVEISAAYPPAFLHPATIQIELAEGRTVAHSMPPLRAVNLSAYPGNGLVRINGIYAGATPLINFRVPAGEHEFRFEWPNGKSRTVRETIANDGQQVFATAPE